MELNVAISESSRALASMMRAASPRWHRFALEFLTYRRWRADSANLGIILNEIGSYLQQSEGRSSGLFEYLEVEFPINEDGYPRRATQIAHLV